MGKRILFGLSLMLCASLALADSVRVKGARVNVRSGPSTKDKVVAKVVKGDTLQVLDFSGDWIKVTNGRMTGWIYEKLVVDVPDSTASTRASREEAVEASSSSDDERPVRSRAPVDGETKMFSPGLGISFASDEINFGAFGRVFVAPTQKLPPLRVIVALDYFFKENAPWMITGNVAYMFDTMGPQVRPYVGAGIIHSRSEGASSTDVDIAVGAQVRERFFAEGRIILAEGNVMIFSAGVKF